MSERLVCDSLLQKASRCKINKKGLWLAHIYEKINAILKINLLGTLVELLMLDECVESLDVVLY